MQQSAIPKILVGCPISDYHEYCTEEYLNAVKNLTYSNYDILLVDNSKDDRFFNSIKDKVPVIRGKYLENPFERLVYNRNLLRQEALDKQYDYLFSLEQDIIPPNEIIERLLRYDKDIITGIYFKPWTRGKEKIMLAMIWAFHPTDPTKKLNIREDIVMGNHLLKIGYCGLGCVLIRRHILEKIKFRYEPSEGEAFDDMFFCKDAKEHGFEIYADTAVKCRHLIANKPWNWQELTKNFNQVAKKSIF